MQGMLQSKLLRLRRLLRPYEVKGSGDPTRLFGTIFVLFGREIGIISNIF